MKLWLWIVKEDQNINDYVFGGTRKETMSGRMGHKILDGNSGCCYLRGLICAVLSVIDFRTWKDGSNHCIKSNKKENNAAK